jgi:hypothetical protein
MRGDEGGCWIEFIDAVGCQRLRESCHLLNMVIALHLLLRWWIVHCSCYKKIISKEEVIMRNNLRKTKKDWIDAWTAFVTLPYREACLAYRVAEEDLNRIVSK